MLMREAKRVGIMDDKKWRDLCQMIMAEQDPEKLWALVNELNNTFDQRENELRAFRSGMKINPLKQKSESETPEEST